MPYTLSVSERTYVRTRTALNENFLCVSPTTRKNQISRPTLDPSARCYAFHLHVPIEQVHPAAGPISSKLPGFPGRSLFITSKRPVPSSTCRV